MENEENQLIETVDEDGNVINFELYDIVEVDEQDFTIAVRKLIVPEESEEAEIVIMRLSKDGEDYIFETIDDDEEFNKVAEYVENLSDEEGEEEE